MISSSSGDPRMVVGPSDFHNLTARFRIPFAPAFLPRPKRTLSMKPIKIEEEGEEEEEEEEDKKQKTEGLSLDDVDNKSDQVKPSTNSATPSFTGGAVEAVNQTLASFLMKYVPSLGCVLLSYTQPPTFIFGTGPRKQRRQRIQPDRKTPLPFETAPGSAWASINVEVELMGWRPTIGQRLVGRPTHSSPSHLSLLLYQTFNASIPENHLKPAGFYYDPNLAIPQSWKDRGMTTTSSSRSEGETDQQTEQETSVDDQTASHLSERGCWASSSGQIVGGEKGLITFTVISLTIANNMISVIGSLLPNALETPIQELRPHPPDNQINNDESTDDESDQQSTYNKPNPLTNEEEKSTTNTIQNVVDQVKQIEQQSRLNAPSVIGSASSASVKKNLKKKKSSNDLNLFNSNKKHKFVKKEPDSP